VVAPVVTPLAGVWIEICERGAGNQAPPSHPSRVCGLKSLDADDGSVVRRRHTPRGCVD